MKNNDWEMSPLGNLFAACSCTVMLIVLLLALLFMKEDNATITLERGTIDTLAGDNCTTKEWDKIYQYKGDVIIVCKSGDMYSITNSKLVDNFNEKE